VGIAIIALGSINYVWMATPTKGPKISEYQTPQAALMVVDVREDISGPASKMLDSSKLEHLISTVNQVIETAKSRKITDNFIGERSYINE